MINIALIGNPNSGKTTLFNMLTGSNQSVGNWPGVTVAKKSGKLRSENIEATIIDLPGLYSLSTISLEEEIAAKYVTDKNMDLIVNIVDASNLERNLFLTFQLLDSDIPVIIALNAMDLVEKNKEEIFCDLMSERLSTPVIPIVASKSIGIDKLIETIETMDLSKKRPQIKYDDEVESTIKRFDTYIKNRFTSIRFFEDGLKALENVKLAEKDTLDLVEEYEQEKKKHKLDFDMVLPDARYKKIIEIVDETHKKNRNRPVSMTDRIDNIITNKYLGIPIFALIMFLVFFLAFGPMGMFITNQLIFVVDKLFVLIIDAVKSLGMADFVSSLLANGVFGGLGAVLGFLPQLMILFLFMSLLEDSGYMARAAFIMDRALRRFGLSGKSFIPMLIGFGCSVPAIAATRTLDRDHDRKITTMIVPFMSCGAKAPIYGVFAGALFGGISYVVVFSMYVIGIVVAILSAVLFKKTIFRKAEGNYIMELPEYRKPTIRNTWLHTWERSKSFLVKAGTILLAAFIVIWFLSYFGFVNGQFRLLSNAEIGNSLLGSIGKFILPVFKPIGFADWQPTVAFLTGFVAKESVVGTLGILYGVNGDAIQNGALLYSSIRAAFTPAQAFSFMTFALLSTPCIAAVTAMKRELNSWKWFIFTIAYQMGIAYLISFIAYKIAIVPFNMILNVLFLLMVVFFVAYFLGRFITGKGKTCKDCASCGINSNCTLQKSKEYRKSTKKEMKVDSSDREK